MPSHFVPPLKMYNSLMPYNPYLKKSTVLSLGLKDRLCFQSFLTLRSRGAQVELQSSTSGVLAQYTQTPDKRGDRRDRPTLGKFRKESGAWIPVA